MLEVSELNVSYGVIPVLHDVSFYVKEGEIVTILGSNGTGKSTILNTIQGFMVDWQDNFPSGTNTKFTTHKILDMGIVQVPEGSKSFPYMTVKENLLLGAYRRASWKKRKETLDYVYNLYPILKKRSNQMARLLSGGEQQMLKIGRGLMANPKLIMVDEPSIGLAPLIVDAVYETLARLRDSGITILLTEQNSLRALQLATRGTLFRRRVVWKIQRKI